MELVAFIAIITSAVVIVGALVYAFAVRRKERALYAQEVEFVGKVDHVRKETETIHEKSEHLIEHARQTAQRILEDAMNKSSKLIRESDSFQQQIEQESRTAFLDASYEYSKKFEKELQDMIVNYKKLFEDAERMTIDTSNKVLEEQKALTTQALRQYTEDLMKTASVEIAQFKESEKGRIAERAGAAVAAIVKSIIGSSFSAQDHEALIKKSLDQAKEEGLFDI